MAEPSDTSAPAGLAALSICESLLLALGDLKVLSAEDIDDVLKDVAETHRNVAELSTGEDAALHCEVVAHAERIRVGGNSGAR